MLISDHLQRARKFACEPDWFQVKWLPLPRLPCCMSVCFKTSLPEQV